VKVSPKKFMACRLLPFDLRTGALYPPERISVDEEWLEKPMADNRYAAYGNLGVDDKQIIDSYLARLPRNAVVVNLGCGPNTHHMLDNLAAAIRRYQFQSTLILADLVVEPIERQIWVPGPAHVRVVALNAATATDQLGRALVDLVLAFALFGALSVSTTPKGKSKDAWPHVLSECFELLKPEGTMIVNNSCERQPFEEFKPHLTSAGFKLSHYHESAPIFPSTCIGGPRYLAVCQKPQFTGGAA